jgi:four helix bundle protein
MARHFSDLVAWQLADEIRAVVLTFTRVPPFATDLKFRSQVEDAADSVCRNVAEGFGCTSHLEFARFLEIARRSLNELLDALHSAQSKRYVSRAETVPVHALARRLYPALGNLMAYLRQSPSQPNRERPDPRSGGPWRGTDATSARPMTPAGGIPAPPGAPAAKRRPRVPTARRRQRPRPGKPEPH